MIELDLLDKKIINELNSNVRASFSQIARKIRSSKEVVNYRIKRLENEEIIKGYVTIFGFDYWPTKMLISFSKINPKEEKEVFDYLISNNNINWITNCSGDWDVVFTIMAKNPKDLDSILRDILKEIGQFVGDYKLSNGVGSTTFGHKYILNTENEPREIKKLHGKNIEFDEKDRKIANILLRNARARLLDISTETNIPVDTVKYRIKIMESSFIIRRYRLILDSSKLGYNRHEIFLRCISLSEDIINKFKNFAKSSPSVEYFSRCVGSWDVEFTVHFKTNMDLRNFIIELKKEFGNFIQKFELINLFETKNFTYLPKELK